MNILLAPIVWLTFLLHRLQCAKAGYHKEAVYFLAGEDDSKVLTLHCSHCGFTAHGRLSPGWLSKATLLPDVRRANSISETIQ